MRLTGGQVVARALKAYGVKFVAGVPGHGIWSLFDAFLEKGSNKEVVTALREIAEGIVTPALSDVTEVDPRFVTRNTPSAAEAIRAESDVEPVAETEPAAETEEPTPAS